MKLARNISTKTAMAFGGMLLFTSLAFSQGDMSGTKGKAMSNAKVMVSPSPVPYQRKVKVTISGSGFAANQELELLMPIGGVPTDISGMVKPKPKSDAQGMFTTVWTLDGEIRGKLLEPTSYTLEVLSTDGEVLAKAPFVFQKVEKKKK